MKFSDTTNKTGLIQDCETLLGMADAGISGDATLLKTFTRLLNVWYRKANMWIWEVQSYWDYDDKNLTDLPVATTDMVDAQQDYSIPTTAQKILRVEAKNANGDWILLNEIDESNIPYALDEYYETDGMPAQYRLSGNSLFLYPSPSTGSTTLTAGLKIYFSRDIDEFTSTDTTQEPGFLNSFHRILPLGACLDYTILRIPQMSASLKAQLLDEREGLINFYRGRNVYYKGKIKPGTVSSI